MSVSSIKKAIPFDPSRHIFLRPDFDPIGDGVTRRRRRRFESLGGIRFDEILERSSSVLDQRSVKIDRFTVFPDEKSSSPV
jgi:hypothetical protein